MGFTWDGLWDDISSGVSGFLTEKDGSLDWGNIATVGGGIAGALGLFDGEVPKTGYQGSIPRYTMVRDKVPGTNDPNRRPGSSGQRYLTRPQYVKSEGLPAARAASEAEAKNLALRNAEVRKEVAGAEEAPTTSSNIMDFVQKAKGGPIQRFANGGMPQANTMMQQRPAMPKQMAPQGMPQGNMPRPPMPQGQPKPQMPMQNFNAGIGGLGAKPPMPMPAPAAALMPQAPAKQNPEDILASLAATGKVAPPPAPAPAPMPMAPQSMPQRPPQMPGVNPMAMRNFANGGIANAMPQRPMAPRQGGYLGGQTDGMADRIPANIEGQQPAALSDGEFVIPADVVSHLGNGNSNAGADNLYKMMEQVRKARTGRPEQGRQIDPNKFMPRG
jgi:hypothetical protein